MTHETIGNSHEQGPQLTGLVHEIDVYRAHEDERTLLLPGSKGEHVFVTPVENNSELNQSFFEGSDAYYVSDVEVLDADGIAGLASFIADSPAERKLVFEYSVQDNTESAEQAIQAAFEQSGRNVEIDNSSIDAFNETLAGVTHFYSRINRLEEAAISNGGILEAYKKAIENGSWQEFSDMGVVYVNGQDLDEKTLESLWDVYDETFDVLVGNHTSAQKQPKEDFLAQCVSPNSHITYIEDEEEIVSALFVIDDITKCNWLNAGFFKQLNAEGATIFVPSISTRIDKKGFSYSPKTISAMASLVKEAGEITGFATQCTNRSVDYIPKIAEKATAGTCNLEFQITDSISYPSFIVR